MKKKMLVIMVFLLTMVGVGCTTEVDAKVNLGDASVEENTKQGKRPAYVLVEEKCEDVQNDRIEYINLYQYDAEGNLISSENTNFFRNKIVWTYENGEKTEGIYYEYVQDWNEVVKLESSTVYKEDGKLLEEKVEVIDEGDGIDGGMRKIYTCCDGGKSIVTLYFTDYFVNYIAIEEIDYDDNGKISGKTIKQGSYGEIDNRIDVEPIYDNSGRIIFEIYYDAEGNQLSYDEYFYDENGNVEKIITAEANGDVTYITTFRYEKT